MKPLRAESRQAIGDHAGRAARWDELLCRAYVPVDEPWRLCEDSYCILDAGVTMLNDDFVFGDDDHDQAKGGAGIDYLDGGSGNDDLCGGGDDDVLYGQDDDDTLFGDQGTDYNDGGPGTDACENQNVTSCSSYITTCQW